MDKKDMRFRYFILVTGYWLLVTLLAGCATAPRRPEARLPGLLEGKTFRIGKTSYVYLRDLCRAYDLAWDWDTLGKKITLYREGIRIDLALDSQLAIINNKKIDLGDKARISHHQFAIPALLLEKVSVVLYPALSGKPEVLPAVGTYKIKRIVIDPGHGGRDPGALSPDGLKEKNLVLKISKDLKEYLERQGLEVILTRDKDRFVSLWRRAHIANLKKADLFISIHANSSRFRQAKGFEIYYLSERMDDAARALAYAENAVLELEGERFSTTNIALAATLWDLVQTENRAEAMHLSRHIGDSVEKLDWIRNRGIKGGLFYVLRGANMPAILIEAGFISNLGESRKLDKDSYRKELVERIGEGILDYKEEYERTDGFTR
jgi:N-acetylmuramoyl-L-alanine amidase